VKWRLIEILIRDHGDPMPSLWSFWVNNVLGSFAWTSRVRTQLLRASGLDLSPRALVRGGVLFRSPNVHVGPGTVISYRCLFDTREGVWIGKNVGIGARVSFQTSDHDMTDPNKRSGKPGGAPIRVGDGARIATDSVILPGVTIGDGAVVGARSLVTRDCDPHTLYMGQPARKVRQLPGQFAAE